MINSTFHLPSMVVTPNSAISHIAVCLATDLWRCKTQLLCCKLRYHILFYFEVIIKLFTDVTRERMMLRF